MMLAPSGIVNDTILSQHKNAKFCILWRFFGQITSFNAEQSIKADLGMVLIPSGIEIDCRDLQPLNALSPKVVSPGGSLMLCKSSQKLKA